MKKVLVKAKVATLLALAPVFAMAQGNTGIQAGAQAITQATADLQSYFEPVVGLVYIIAAIVGVMGAYRIYSKIQSGDQDVQKSVVGWIGSFLFLLATATVLQAVFF